MRLFGRFASAAAAAGFGDSELFAQLQLLQRPPVVPEAVLLAASRLLLAPAAVGGPLAAVVEVLLAEPAAAELVVGQLAVAAVDAKPLADEGLLAADAGLVVDGLVPPEPVLGLEPVLAVELGLLPAVHAKANYKSVRWMQRMTTSEN